MKISQATATLQTARNAYGRFSFVKMNLPFLPDLLNHLLADDPLLRRQLARHAGKTMLVETGLATIRLQVAADGLFQPLPASQQEELPNVTLFMRWTDLPMLLQDRSKAMSAVQIEGDADFASTLAKVAQGLRWDAEADLSRLVGDIPAHRLTGLAQQSLQAASASQRRLSAAIAEYLSEEQPVLTPVQMLPAFTEALNRLRDDTERMTKRVERLEKFHSQRSNPCS